MNIDFKRLPQILSRSCGTKFFFIGLAAMLASGCNESSVVGLNVQPPSDLLNVGWQDTTTLVTSTLREDSLHTDASVIVTGDALLGTYIDPVFGKTSASSYTQLRLPGNNPYFGINPVCDSVVLCLTYSSDYYGKRQRKPQRISVYQLSEDLNTNKNYYSNNSLTHYSDDLANGYVYVPRPLSKVYVLGDSLKPHLRVPLAKVFGSVILNAQGSPNLVNTVAFQAFCKGLYITSDLTTSSVGDGNILHFKMGDTQSKVTIYYHNSNPLNNDSLKYDISLANVGRFSSFEHYGYTSAYPYLYSQLTSVGNDTALFVQSLAGTKVKIELPYLSHLNDGGKIAVNKAELVLKIDTTNALYQRDTFAIAGRLILFGISPTNGNYTLPDAYESNESYDGSYNIATKEYHFNIERYIQRVLNGTITNTGLFLVTSGGAVNAGRVVLGSGSSKGYQKMKLNITYTKLH